MMPIDPFQSISDVKSPEFRSSISTRFSQATATIPFKTAQQVPSTAPSSISQSLRVLKRRQNSRSSSPLSTSSVFTFDSMPVVDSSADDAVKYPAVDLLQVDQLESFPLTPSSDVVPPTARFPGASSPSQQQLQAEIEETKRKLSEDRQRVDADRSQLINQQAEVHQQQLRLSSEIQRFESDRAQFNAERTRIEEQFVKHRRDLEALRSETERERQRIRSETERWVMQQRDDLQKVQSAVEASAKSVAQQRAQIEQRELALRTSRSQLDEIDRVLREKGLEFREICSNLEQKVAEYHRISAKSAVINEHLQRLDTTERKLSARFEQYRLQQRQFEQQQIEFEHMRQGFHRRVSQHLRSILGSSTHDPLHDQMTSLLTFLDEELSAMRSEKGSLIQQYAALHELLHATV